LGDEEFLSKFSDTLKETELQLINKFSDLLPEFIDALARKLCEVP